MQLVDFKNIILDYVQLQIEYNQQVEKSWREALPSLKVLQVQEGKDSAVSSTKEYDLSDKNDNTDKLAEANTENMEEY